MGDTFSKGSAPTPPNPIATGAAQTGTNVSTAVANGWLNATNQYTPNGNLEYTQAGTHPFTDPVTGITYQVPQFSAVQHLTPQGEATNNLNQSTQGNLAGIANERSAAIGNLLHNNVELGGAPTAGNPYMFNDIPDAMHDFSYEMGAPQSNLSWFGDTGSQQRTFDQAGDVTRSYGPADDFSSDRSRVEGSLFDRLNPQLNMQRDQLEQRLADQGIRYGSQAYNDAMDNYSRQANDARLAVTARGGEEQKLMMDMAAQRAGFQNAAQQQAYMQAQGRGTFANEAQSQDFLQTQQRGTFANQAQKDWFQQDATRAQLYNAAQAQALAKRQALFDNSNTARAAYMQEQYAQRNQPINEIGALLSGSQVGQPNFVNTPSNKIPTTDYAGLINNNFSQNLDIYKQQSANFNSLMGGIFGMMGGLSKASDERIKDVGDQVGTVFAAGPDGEKPLPIYEYAYKADPASTRHVGPMAQDVEKIDPRAVKTISGVKHIDMTRMGSILRPVVTKKAA